MSPAIGLALEPEHPAVMHGPVDDRRGHVRIPEHPAPPAGLDVRGVNDGLHLVRVGDDLEQQPAAFLVDRHVAQLVDDQQAGLADGRDLPVEFAFRAGAQQAHDQASGGEEPYRHAFQAGLPSQRHRQMGFARAGRPEHDRILRTARELQ